MKVKSLPPQQINGQSMIKRTSLTSANNDDSMKIYQCKYCAFTSHWSKDISRHQRDLHPNYPPHILQKEYSTQDDEINNNSHHIEVDQEDDEGISTLLIDPVRAFGEVIDTNEEEQEPEEDEEPEMLMGNGIDDDEEEA